MVYAYSISDDKNYCDVTRVDLKPRILIATRLVKEDFSVYHYARAGEDLPKGVFVEPGLTEEDRFTLAFSQKMDLFADIVYGKVVATIGDPRGKPGVLGWPVVEVKKGYYFWLREIPVGAELIKEEERGKIW